MVDDRFKVKFNENATQTPVMFDFRLDDHDSLVLFDILVELLKEQKGMGPRARVGFLLNVVIIDNSEVTKAKTIVEMLKTKYDAATLKELSVKFQIINPGAFCSNQMDVINLTENYGVDVISNKGGPLSYWELLEQVHDYSTREYLANSIHDELLRQVTKGHIIIEADSMTTLAINILSLAIEGRGNEIANVLTDTEMLFHPLRDVLHSELRVYAQLESLDEMLPPAKREVVKPEAKSAKNKTVHELVSEYFQTIELEYPEVVSTVEKIGSKLNSPSGLEGQVCPVCNKSIQDDAKQWLEQITVKGFAPMESEEDLANLERYKTFIGLNEDTEPATEKGYVSKLCYGCLVTLGASGVSQINWPKQQTDAEILEEYILTDSED